MTSTARNGRVLSIPTMALALALAATTALPAVAVTVDPLDLLRAQIAASTNNTTITLTDDVGDGSQQLDIERSVTIDLDGHAVALEITRLAPGVTLTIDDSSPTATGTWTSRSTTDRAAGIRTTGATLQVVGGRVEGRGGAGAAGVGGDASASGGHLIVDGGSVSGSGEFGAGIGGGLRGHGGTIELRSGSAIGFSRFGAGVGGGELGDGAELAVVGGSITGTSTLGAGVGGGTLGAGGNISVSGGFISGMSDRGAAIGGGQSATGATLTVSAGRISGFSNYGAGIGGGEAAAGSTTTITGGIVNGRSLFGAGIGGGQRAAGGDTTVTGGTVVAESSFGAGIGGGGSADADTAPNGILTTITGGTVTARGGNTGAGIGGASAGAGGTVVVSGGIVDATGGARGAPGIGGGGIRGAGAFVTIGANGGTVPRVTTSSVGTGVGIGGGVERGNTARPPVNPSGTLTIGTASLAGGSLATSTTVLPTASVEVFGATPLSIGATLDNSGTITGTTPLTGPGTLVNGGTVCSPIIDARLAGEVTPPGLTVTGTAFVVTFDTGASPSLPPRAVYAETLAACSVSLPDLSTPTRTMVEWVSTTSGAPVTASTLLSGVTDTGGDPSITVRPVFVDAAPPPGLASLTATPGTATVEKTGSITLRVDGQDVDGAPVEVPAEAVSVTSSDVHDIVSGTTITFPFVGARTIAVAAYGFTATITVDVVDPQTPVGVRVDVVGDAVAGAVLTKSVVLEGSERDIDITNAVTAITGPGLVDLGDGGYRHTAAGVVPLTITAGGRTFTSSVTIAAGPLDELTVTPSMSTVTQGGSVTLAVAGQDAFGNPVDIDPADIVVTSDVPTDVIEGLTITFPTASPHTLTVTVGTVSATVVIEVEPAAAPPTAATPLTTALPRLGGANPAPLGLAGVLLLTVGLGILAARRGAHIRRGRDA